MMDKSGTLKILMLEDSSDDAELVQRLLLKESPHFHFRVAMSKELFLQELDNFQPDLILADNSMPDFSSADALKIVRERNLLTPFILITGTVSEEFAAKIIKLGADDYFLKDRLTRLPVAIDAALKQRRLEKERLEDQRRMKTAHDRLLFHVENAPLGFIEWDDNLKIKSLSRQASMIFGWDEEHSLEEQTSGISHVYEEDLPWVKQTVEKLLSGEIRRNNIEHRNYTRSGKVIWCEWFNSVLTEDNGKVVTIMSLVQDITEKKLAAEAIQKSEQKYRTLVEEAFDGILIYSPDGTIIDFNDSACDYLGYSRKEFSNMNIRELYHNERELNPPEIKQHISGKAALENRKLQRKDGTFIEMEIATKMLPGGNFMVIARDLTERNESARALYEMEEKILNQKVQEQKKITRAMIHAQENERNYIGQELHDNINQILVGAKLYLTVAAKRNPVLNEAIEYPKELIDTAMNEIRLLSSNYVTPLKNIDLRGMVEMLLSNLRETTAIKTTFSYRVVDTDINDDLKLNIYRIIQEQANNIVKHAAANNIQINVETIDENIHVTIQDDGIGFDINKNRTGVGISNMMNRIESFNGKFTIDSAIGKGCTIDITIPCC
ncbi:MAG: PAS domain S-box protein [Ferruginibacter sp.]